MHFPSLAIIASLACAAFSAALPVAVADPPPGVSDALTNFKSELHHVARDVPNPPPAPAPPAAPSPPSTPTPPEAPATPSVTIVDVLQSLIKGLTPLVDELEKAVRVKVDATVDSEGVLAVVHAIIALLQRHAQLALTSVGGTVSDTKDVVVTLVPQILTLLATALVLVKQALGTVTSTLDPLLAEIDILLGVIVAQVIETVPGVVDLIKAQLVPVVDLLMELNLKTVLGIVGLSSNPI